MYSFKQCLKLACENATKVILRDFTNYYYYQEDLSKQHFIINPKETIGPQTLWQKCSTVCDFGSGENPNKKCETGINDVHVFEDLTAQPPCISNVQEPHLESNLRDEDKLKDNFQTLEEIETNPQKSHHIKEDNVEENIQILGILAANQNKSNKTFVSQNSSSLKYEADAENLSEIEHHTGFSYEESCCKNANESKKIKTELSVNDCHFCIKKQELVLGQENFSFSDDLAQRETIPESFLNTPTKQNDKSDNVESFKNTDIGSEEIFLNNEKDILSCHSQEEISPVLIPIEIQNQYCIQRVNNSIENDADTKTSSDSSKIFLEDTFKSIEEFDGLLKSFSDIDSECLSDHLIKELLANMKEEECNCTTTVGCLQVEYFEEDEEFVTKHQLESVETGSNISPRVWASSASREESGTRWLANKTSVVAIETVPEKTTQLSNSHLVPLSSVLAEEAPDSGTVEDEVSISSEEELHYDEHETSTKHIQEDEHIQKALYITQWLDSMDLENIQQSPKYHGSGDMSS